MRDRLRRWIGRAFDPLQAGDDDTKALYLALTLFCGAALLVGYLFVPGSQAHASGRARVLLEGKPVTAQEDLGARALEVARSYLRGTFKLTAGPWQFKTTRAALGVRVDLTALTAMLQAARDPGSPLRRLHLQEQGDLPLSIEVPARVTGRQAANFLLRVKDQIFQRARDARVDLRSGKLVAEQTGLSLDVHGTLDDVEAAILDGRTEVAARLLKSDVTRTRKTLEKLDFSGVLGSFESRYNALDRDRSFNLRVAAQHIDGVVLMPGEVFDFNRLVGERSEASGFRPAPEIASGELTDGVGGGTCQIAGTLHAAVFFSGLPFLERYPHTRPSTYLKLGLDATVSYPKLNFRFQNDLPHAVAIGIVVEKGQVRAEVRGPRGRERVVSFVRHIDKVTPFSEVVRDDASLPNGVKVLAQRGVAGFEVTSFRLIGEPDSDHAVRERRRDVYPPTTQIWRRGRGPAARAGYVPPAGDSHGEYRAEEDLILTMGPSTQGLEEKLQRERQNGYAGWTAKQGLPPAPPQ